MKVKKYTARTMADAMQLIKRELGSDAVILQSKQITKGGFLGFFKKKQFEVVAALDPNPTSENKTSSPQKPTIKQMGTSPLSHFDNQEDVMKEIKDLKMLLEKQAFTSDNHYPPVYEWVYQYLLDQEMNNDIAIEMIDELLLLTKDMETPTKGDLKQPLETVLGNRLDDSLFEPPLLKKKIIQFVGPTGVGKTTTLAKVAAQCKIQEKKKIAFITMDTYRIAAIEQLKTYATILDVPVEVAYSINDYQNALKKFEHYDHIFVDTAGRNYRNPQYIHELKQMLNIEKTNAAAYLVLTLTAKATDITDIYQQFLSVHVEKVIFSKVDETTTYGSIFNVCMGEGSSILYLTNGQDVPDDLIIPSKPTIISLLLSGYHDE